jgi:hypothetical protein
MIFYYKTFMFLSEKWSLFIFLCLSHMMRAQTDTSLSICPVYGCYNDQAPAGIMMSHVHEKGQWMFSYRYMYMPAKGIVAGTETIGNEQIFKRYVMAPESMYMHMHMLMCMYGVNNRITLMGMVHYQISTMNMAMYAQPESHRMRGMEEMEGGMDHSMKTTGPGDTRISALYSLVNVKRHHLMLIMGISMPTGSLYKKGGINTTYPDRRFPYAMQLGSGTWDLQPGLSYLYVRGRLSLGSQLTGTWHPFYNTVGYKYGDEILFNSWINIQSLNWLSNTLRLQGSYINDISGKDPDLYTEREPSSNPANYGGKYLTAFAGINFYLKNNLIKNNKFAAEFGIPLYQNLNGVQMCTAYCLQASWSITF